MFFILVYSFRKIKELLNMQLPYIETFCAFLFVPPALSEVCCSIITLPVDSRMKTNLTLI